MQPDVPLSAVIAQIVSHTPSFVWAILAALVVLGSLQLRDQRISRTRLLVAPIALGAFSLWGATRAFGATPLVLGAWALGMACAFAANRALRWPRGVRADGDAFLVPGSAWPLVLMMAIFALRYAVAVTLAFHPGWVHDGAFGGGLAVLFGALSGLFTARAVRILTSGAQPRLAAA